jgi:hypothetical protein
MIRDFKDSDIFDVEDLQSEFPLPNFKSPTNIAHKTLLVENKIVGTAFVHLTAEIGLIIDKQLPKLTRARLIKELFTVLIDQMGQTDLEDYHIYVVPENDLEYVEFLNKNFGFVRDKGISLTRFNNEQSKRERSQGFGEKLDGSGS